MAFVTFLFPFLHQTEISLEIAASFVTLLQRSFPAQYVLRPWWVPRLARASARVFLVTSILDAERLADYIQSLTTSTYNCGRISIRA